MLPVATEQPLKIERPMGTVLRAEHGKRAGFGGSSKEVVRFCGLGGLEEIGRNMSFFEYGDEIVIFDAGLEFAGEENPGVDYIIPNTIYLEQNKHKIRAMVITHAHYDHIGAIPHIMEKLGNPTIYTTALAKEIINKRQKDYPNTPKLDFEIVKNMDVIKVSDNLSLEFFNIIHSIPDSISILVKTPIGNFMYATDVKVEYDAKGQEHGLEEFRRVAQQGVHALFLDSTNAEVQGKSLSGEIILDNIENIILKTEGRLIIAMFASMLTRVGEVIGIAEKHNKKIAFSGLSMKTNVEIAQNLGYIKIQQGTIIPLEDLHKYKDNQVIVLSTGAQGESNASLMKIATGEHRTLRVQAGDTIMFSSSIIPGNERAVQTLKDSLARQGAIIYHSKNSDIYSSGHATVDELKAIISAVKPKHFVPIHGYYFMRSTNAILAQECGVAKENTIVLDNGLVAEFSKTGFQVDMDHQLPAYYIMVDGLGVGDVGEIVMRDRKMLAEEGMVVIIATIDKRTGNIIKNPDIISRGFIYLKENQDIVEEMRKKIKGIITKMPSHRDVEMDYLKSLIRDEIGQFLYIKTKRRPMILPVVIHI
jgi:ribonuclease J